MNWYVRVIGIALSAALLTLPAQAVTDMTTLPAGSYQRADGETVGVDAFSMLTTEVTWSQFKTVKDWAEQNGYDFEAGIGQADLPAQNITWYDAAKWCNALSEMTGRTPVYQPGGKVYRTGRADLVSADVKWDSDGYRLPTEAEWEYAYRAGTTTKFYWGDYPRQGVPINAEYAAYHFWGTDEIDGGPLAVASKKPNAFGLHDMAGNVEEWVWDRYAIDYEGVGADNPRGPDHGSWRVMRGGGFVIDRLFTAYTRHPSYPFWINTDIGFRIASSNPQADAKTLTEIETLPLTPNDSAPFTEPHTVLDVREPTDEAACKRLMPLLDVNHPNLAAVRAAYEKQDYAAALTALRNLLTPRLKASHLEPIQSTFVNKKEADHWLAIYREERPIRWAGPDTDLTSPWGYRISDHLAKAWARWPEKTEYAEAFFWMLDDVARRAKPSWNRLTKTEKGSKGKPRDSFYAFIGFDAGHPLRPFANIACMLQHDFPEAKVPPRILADALFYAVNDRLAAGLQDDRGFVPNQVWGNAIAIIEFSQLFPELKDAAELRAEGIHRVRKAMGTVMPDGTDLEASLNYNARLFPDRKKLNQLFPDRDQWPDWLVEFNRRTDYRHYMYASLATPFATNPAIGNTQPTDTRARKSLKQRLANGDLKGLENAMNRLLASVDERPVKGPKPAFTSVGLPHGGYYAQRSGWSPDDHYLFMRSSRDGVGHNHHDNNNIQLAAYGTWLLLDSGSPAYGARFLPDHQKKYRHYFGEPGIGNVFMANCLSVDGLVQGTNYKQLEHVTAGWETPRKNLLHHSENFDLTEGVYDGWYHSEKPISDKNMADLVEDHGLDNVAEIVAYNARLKHQGERKLRAVHRRLAIFLRQEKFWVLVDEVDGGSEYIQTWNFPPVDRGLNRAKYFLEPSDEDLYYGKQITRGYTPSEVRSDEAMNLIATVSHYRPNIAILNFTPHDVRYTQHYGDKFPFKGWQSFGIGGEKVPAVQMEGAWRGDVPMVTALYPIRKRARRDNTIDAGLDTFSDRSADDISGFTYSRGKTAVTVRASREPAILNAGPVSATATLLLVRKDGKGNLSGIVLGCSGVAAHGEKQTIPALNSEFFLAGGDWTTTAIRPPETFRWQDHGKGQLIPAYR